MLESLKVSAQLTTVLEADVTPILRLRAVHKDEFLRRTGTKLSYLPFFAKAAVDALSQHRMLNAELNAENTEVTYHGAVHLGIAVDGPKGLMVPVIRNAEGASVRTLATSIAAAADRVRSNSITVDELNGGTFTITNTGSRGALFDTPIINQPQTGILGVGAVVERVVSMCDQQNGLGIGIRSMVYLSLTYDHRIVDGADAARYLSAVKEHLESGFGDGDLDC
jgi:2-oxoglutarate dehydrogenase E2 component (dihydrolipoamide succinyltransferase)